jgi:hypothetical protein
MADRLRSLTTVDGLLHLLLAVATETTAAAAVPELPRRQNTAGSLAVLRASSRRHAVRYPRRAARRSTDRTGRGPRRPRRGLPRGCRSNRRARRGAGTTVPGALEDPRCRRPDRGVASEAGSDPERSACIRLATPGRLARLRTYRRAHPTRSATRALPRQPRLEKSAVKRQCKRSSSKLRRPTRTIASVRSSVVDHHDELAQCRDSTAWLVSSTCQRHAETDPLSAGKTLTPVAGPPRM